jgi:hypothetical protein
MDRREISHTPGVSSLAVIVGTIILTLLAAAPCHAQGYVKHGDWHISLIPELWLPGVHGTVGAFDHTVDAHVSTIDLLSHFRFGLMGAADTRWKRLVLPVDFVWVRLGGDHGVPLPDLGAESANWKAGVFILTPEVGVRLVDNEKFTMDAVTGIRYWHFSENLKFSPSALGLDITPSENLVDPLVGTRFEAAVSPKVSVKFQGDVGGFGAGSQVEYQLVGLLGYKVKPNLTLQGGYRYLYIDYRSRNTIFDMAFAGILLRVDINLK